MSRSKVLSSVVKSAVDRTLFLRERSSGTSSGIIIDKIRSSSSAFASTSSRSSSSSSTIKRKTKRSRRAEGKREMSSLSNGGQGQGVDANWKPHQPVQSKRPAYLPEDTPHTKKWLDSDASKVPPIGVNASKVNCHSPGACKERFGEGAALGAPATFYTLADTSVENPAKCKYCGLRFYSLEGSH
jgi:NADH dehydrogenase (ubiquinone) Fe-S protein 6